MKKIIILIFAALLLNSCSIENSTTKVADSNIINEASNTENENITKVVDEDKKIIATIERIGENKLIISGKASGSWFFEASFPIMIEDENENIIEKHYATASGNSLTSDYVEFNSEIEYTNSGSKYGYVVFQNDNPSGMKEYLVEKKVKIKIKD